MKRRFSHIDLHRRIQTKETDLKRIQNFQNLVTLLPTKSMGKYSCDVSNTPIVVFTYSSPKKLIHWAIVKVVISSVVG